MTLNSFVRQSKVCISLGVNTPSLEKSNISKCFFTTSLNSLLFWLKPVKIKSEQIFYITLFLSRVSNSSIAVSLSNRFRYPKILWNSSYIAVLNACCLRHGWEIMWCRIFARIWFWQDWARIVRSLGRLWRSIWRY